MLSSFFHRWLWALAFVLAQSRALAATEFNDRTLPAFARSYFRLELVRETPLQRTQAILESGEASPLFGYRYNLANTWLMGVSMVFRNFKSVGKGTPLSFLAVSHESLYILRLYHPMYFMFGPAFSYLMPSRTAQFPTERDPNYDMEIGASLAAHIAYIINDRWFLDAKVERWRGTSTDKIHGLETGVSVNVNLE